MKNINFSRCFISQKAARSDAFFLCRKATIKTKKKMRKRESLEAKNHIRKKGKEGKREGGGKGKSNGKKVGK